MGTARNTVTEESSGLFERERDAGTIQLKMWTEP